MRKTRERLGLGRTPTYRSWASMRARCKNHKNNEKYRWYRGRGIIVCRRWAYFSNFLADMGERPDGSCLDRIDNADWYYKENCRWVTMATQNRNKRSNIWLTLDGKTMILADWAKETGISRAAIENRYHSGWDTTRILTEKPFSYLGKIQHKITYKGKTVSISELSRLTGIARKTIRNKIKKGELVSRRIY